MKFKPGMTEKEIARMRAKELEKEAREKLLAEREAKLRAEFERMSYENIISRIEKTLAVIWKKIPGRLLGSFKEFLVACRLELPLIRIMFQEIKNPRNRETVIKALQIIDLLLEEFNLISEKEESDEDYEARKKVLLSSAKGGIPQLQGMARELKMKKEVSVGYR